MIGLSSGRWGKPCSKKSHLPVQIPANEGCIGMVEVDLQHVKEEEEGFLTTQKSEFRGQRQAYHFFSCKRYLLNNSEDSAMPGSRLPRQMNNFSNSLKLGKICWQWREDPRTQTLRAVLSKCRVRVRNTNKSMLKWMQESRTLLDRGEEWKKRGKAYASNSKENGNQMGWQAEVSLQIISGNVEISITAGLVGIVDKGKRGLFIFHFSFAYFLAFVFIWHVCYF